MESLIIVSVFSFITIIVAFSFCGYVLRIVLGDIRKELPSLPDQIDSFTPLTEVPPEHLKDWMNKRLGNKSFVEGRTLTLDREVLEKSGEQEQPEDQNEMITDPGENSIM